MRGRGIIAFLLVAALIFTSSCIFKPSRFRGVISYRDGRVYLKHDKFYRVGILPAGWERMRTRARTISFYNPNYESSISTDAICGGSIANRKLKTLGDELLSALSDRTFIDKTSFELDGRGVLRQKASGTLDGVPVIVDLVVISKNECVFDLYAVTPAGASPVVSEDFETFFSGFHYE